MVLVARLLCEQPLNTECAYQKLCIPQQAGQLPWEQKWEKDVDRWKQSPTWTEFQGTHPKRWCPNLFYVSNFIPAANLKL